MPNVRLSGGIRYTHETKDYFRTTTTSSTLTAPPFGPLLNALSRSNPDQGKWDDCVADGEHRLAGNAGRDVLSPRGQGLQVGRLQRPREQLREATEYKPETCGRMRPASSRRIANQLTLNGAVFTAIIAISRRACRRLDDGGFLTLC